MTGQEKPTACPHPTSSLLSMPERFLELELRAGAPEVDFPVGLHCSVSPFAPTLVSLLPAGFPADSLLGYRSSVLWRKLGGPLLGSLASVNLLFLPHNPLPGDAFPTDPQRWCLCAGINLLMSSGSQSAWIQPAFRSLNPQEICVTLPC